MKAKNVTTRLRVVDATKKEDAELSEETLGRLHAYAVALSAREVTPKWVAEDWPEFFNLALAFVERHGSAELLDALSHARVFDDERHGTHRGALLNGAERRSFLLLARDLRSVLVNTRAWRFGNERGRFD